MLDDHELGDRNAAGLCHPPEVVAPEIHEHHVLRALLRVGHQLFGQHPILHRVPAARSGAGDRPHLQATPRAPHEHLGRGADQRHFRRLEQHHVRRRIDEPQRPVDGGGRHVQVDLPAPGEDDLEDVAGSDVLLRGVHRAGVLLVVQGGVGGLRLDPEILDPGRRRHAAALQDRLQRIEPDLGIRRRRLAFDLVRHRDDPLAGVVEHEHVIETGEDGDRQIERVGRPAGRMIDQARLDEPDRVEAEGEGPATGERQRRRGIRGHAVEQAPQLRQRVAGFDLNVAATAEVFRLQPVEVHTANLRRARTQEAVTRNVLAAGDALEQEPAGGTVSVRVRGQLAVDAERRRGVGQELPGVGNGRGGPAHDEGLPAA